MNLADIEAISQAALRVDTNPVGLAGRLVGLSADEQRAGIPGWAWLFVGTGVGIVGGILLVRSGVLERLPFGGGGS